MSMERFSCMSAGSKVSGSAYARQVKTLLDVPPVLGAVVLVAAAAGAAVVLVGAAAAGAAVSVAAGAAAWGVSVGAAVVPPQAAIMGISITRSTNATIFLENILSFPPKVSLSLRPGACARA